MTSLVAWVGHDTHGVASAYIASDSRITWGTNQKWDYARKVFASLKYPDILGYFGDVSFPSHVLGQVIDIVDTDLFFRENESARIKFSKIEELVIDSFATYPKEHCNPFSIVYISRENEGMESKFQTFLFGWHPSYGWNNEQLEMPSKSGIIRVFGSGKKSIETWHERWNHIDKIKGTSRAVFSAFCDSLANQGDGFSGGAPQLVGIYRKWAGQSFGIIYKNQRYLLGLPVSKSSNLLSIEWRNVLFERCDGVTMARLDDAQIHKHPHGLGKSL